ncbi:PEP-CTERM sorting domain-containing protein [Cerasicoccus maritimus]|uniref:PEP-CTERM sorting domain-containing protein n=1 Tax=Cerasicoccus maritimus TaxID=490089 RepID=UPI0028529D87|nr:PEP-CTERM sorting domain-containing protein [Cerasicoccus maritimus]
MDNRLILPLLAFSIVTPLVNATTLVSGFGSNADGALVGQSTPQGQTWVQFGSVANPLNVSNNTLTLTTTGENTSVNFLNGDTFSDTTLYLGFTMNLSSVSSAGTFFTSFSSNNTTDSSAGRVYVKTDGVSTGDYLLGGRTGAFGGQEYGTIDLNFNQDYRVVMAYTAAGSGATAGYTIYVDPISSTEGDNTIYHAYTRSGAASLNTVGSYQIRQDQVGGVLSNIVVATTFSEAAAIPEPTTYALLLGSLSLLTIVALKRRNR